MLDILYSERPFKQFEDNIMNKISTFLLMGLLSVNVALANSSSHSQHSQPAQPNTEFGKDYLNSMTEMHHGMAQAAFAQDPDVSFAEGMIAHHQGAIEMAKIQLKYGKDPEMRKLAEAVIAAQEPEIKQMQNWLKQHQKHKH